MEDPKTFPGFPPSPAPPQFQAPPLPAPRGSRLWLHALLFLATAVTVAVAGTAWEDSLPRAIVFMLCVLAILTSHEMGHYLACRHYGIPASLPYFLPNPFVFPFGTFGAVIRIRGAIPDRKALFDVAAAGPIAGFAVALPMLVIGILQATPVAAAPQEDMVSLGTPLISYLLESALSPSPGGEMRVGGVYLAGWFGLLITSLNLFPVGQLDGGHAVYALSRSLHRSLTHGTIVLLIAFTTVQAVLLRTLPPYVLWCAILLFLRNRHPRLLDESTPLGRGRTLIALALLALFVLSFIPKPF